MGPAALGWRATRAPSPRARQPHDHDSEAPHDDRDHVLDPGRHRLAALWEWLENHVDPAHRALTPEIAKAASYMAYTEGLRGGTTSVLLETHRTAADGRVRSWVGLEHIFYCSADMFREAADLAEEFDTGIHTHSSESIWDVQECEPLTINRFWALALDPRAEHQPADAASLA